MKKKSILIIFAGSSGIDKAAERIRSLAGGSAFVDAGRRLGGRITDRDLRIRKEGFQL